LDAKGKKMYFHKLILYIVIASINLSSPLFAQAPEIEWFKGYGTNTEEHVHEGMQTSDGGYIAIGHGM